MHIVPLLEGIDSGEDLSDALVRELGPAGRIESECRATLGELLHRARGYGACKSVLFTLATEQNLTLSEIARRTKRTAGSTRDYLRWLEEVELVTVREKRFSFVDPILRLWLRVYGRGTAPSPEELRQEVDSYLSLSTASDSDGSEQDKVAGQEASAGTETLIEID
jgi:hypothetical protein